MILTSFDNYDSNVIVAQEFENITIQSSKSIVIPLVNITDKKYIKINSTISGFNWDFQISQTSDINYLPKCLYKNFEKGNVAYIDNPYNFKNFKNNYYMFISIIHYHKEENLTFSYEYTNERESKEEERDEDDKKESDENKDDPHPHEDDEDDNTGKDSNNSNKVWIIIISIIFIILLILVLGWYFYRKKRINSNSNLENLVNKF